MGRIHSVMDDGRRYYEKLLGRDEGVLVVPATARYGRAGLRVDGSDVDLRGIPTLIASGSRAAIVRLPGIDQTPVLTSDELLRLQTLPRSLAIVGGGPIAIEFAQALCRLGVEVTIVMRADAPLRGEEPEARETIARVMVHDGVRLVTSARTIALEPAAAGARVRWDGGSVEADHVLLATGREPAVAALDPEAHGIELDDGGIAVDDQMRATAERTWAIGDAIGGSHRRYQFTHAATYDGPKAAENALAGAANRPSYAAMPRVTFTDPEVAAVGMTEAEARSAGIDVLAHVKLVRQLGKARAIGESEGFVKVILDRATGKLVGATVVAGHAGDMLAEVTIPLHVNGGELDAVLATTFAHPTVSEAIKVAVRDAVGELRA